MPVVAAEFAPEAPAPKRRRPIGWMITVTLLCLALIAAGVAIYLALQRLEEANDLIEDQQEIIDTKETFGAAARELVATASAFDGVLFDELIPHGYHASLVNRGWDHRWDVAALERDTAEVRTAIADLAEVRTVAQQQAAGNASGTKYEEIIDQLGSGYVSTAIDDADSLCEDDVLACVTSADPYVVHFDAADTSLPYMTDWLRTGLAYHEFAHVLQMTNVEATKGPLEAFGGDGETMADCFALTYLDGWTLDHTVWVSAFEYWEVSIGYGYTCDEGQRQVVRDWYDAIGYTHAALTQRG